MNTVRIAFGRRVQTVEVERMEPGAFVGVALPDGSIGEVEAADLLPGPFVVELRDGTRFSGRMEVSHAAHE